MLKLDDVTRSYRNGKVEARALNGVSLDIPQGQFVAITGPSGCGKSTLLHILGMLDRPTAGRYWFDGAEVTGQPESQLAKHRNEAIGFVFQSFNLIDDLTVAENVEVALIYRGVAAHERKRRVAEQARLRPAQLSGGQQQRAAIARALISRPRLLLADEPTGNLDSENGEAVLDLLKQAVADGVTVVMVTHSQAHADQAQRIVRLVDGRIVSDSGG